MLQIIWGKLQLLQQTFHSSNTTSNFSKQKAPSGAFLLTDDFECVIMCNAADYTK